MTRPHADRPRLSDRQRLVLRAVLSDGKATGASLLFRLRGIADVTEQGLHQTAASLVRRGLIERDRTGAHVAYRVTDLGKAIL